jgi:hypothetical protein
MCERMCGKATARIEASAGSDLRDARVEGGVVVGGRIRDWVAGYAYDGVHVEEE